MQNIADSLGLEDKHAISISEGWNREDFINLLLLSFVYGSYFLLLTIAIFLPGGIPKSEEDKIFILGWFTIPLLSLLALIAIHVFKNIGNKNDVFFYPVFLCSNYALCLLFTIGLKLSWWLRPSINQLSLVVNTILVLFPLIQLAFLWALRKYRAYLASHVSERLIKILYGLLPIIVSIFVANFSNSYFIFLIPAATIIFSILFGQSKKLPVVSSKAPGRWIAWLVNIAAILFIIETCFDPKFAVNIYHQNYYLGPVNAILHGRTILVNVFSQYGVLVLEFLAVIFKLRLVPLSYQGLSYLVALLCMLQFAVIFFLLRTILKSPLYSLLALLVILLINIFAIGGVIQVLPSNGPLRFGLCYPMVVLCALFFKYPAKKRIFSILAYLVLGLASLWSFETFVYVAFIFMGMLVYQSIISNGHELWKVFKLILYGSLLAILSIGISQAIFAGIIFLQTSEWPKWGYYFAFIFLFAGGFGALPADPWSAWFFLIAIYFVCLSGFIIKWWFERKLDAGVEQAVILGLSFSGIAQFTYFLNRSDLDHLIMISVPATIIAFYGVEKMGNLVSPRFILFRKFTIIAFSFALVFLSSLYYHQFLNKFPNTGFAYTQSVVEDQLTGKQSIGKSLIKENNLLWARQPSDEESADAVYLIDKYAGDRTNVTVFLSNDLTTESLLLSNKGNTYLINHPLEDDLNAQVSQYIYDNPPKLHVGDMIFLASDPGQLLIHDDNIQTDVAITIFPHYKDFQQQLVLRLCEEFSFEKVEATLHGVTAFQLRPPGKPSDYCTRLKALK